MGTPTQQQVIRLVTRLIYDTVREAGRLGVPSSYMFMALEQHGCTAAQYQTFLETMTNFGLIASHPSLPDTLICPPGHESVANRLAL
jgi:hypothetical protein